MPHLSVWEAVLDLRREVEHVTIDLAETERQLNDVATRRLLQEAVGGKERKRSVDHRGDRLHAHGERVAPTTHTRTNVRSYLQVKLQDNIFHDH